MEEARGSSDPPRLSPGRCPGRCLDAGLDDTFLAKRGYFSAGPLVGRVLAEGARRVFQAVLSEKHFPWMLHHVVQRVPITGAGPLLIFARAASDFCHWNHEKLYLYRTLTLKIF